MPTWWLSISWWYSYLLYLARLSSRDDFPSASQIIFPIRIECSLSGTATTTAGNGSPNRPTLTTRSTQWRRYSPWSPPKAGSTWCGKASMRIRLICRLRPTETYSTLAISPSFWSFRPSFCWICLSEWSSTQTTKKRKNCLIQTSWQRCNSNTATHW